MIDDDGVRAAVEAAGGQSRLARLLGIKQPTICCWAKVPPLRVLQIEKLTGVSRHLLRPDLYPLEDALSEKGGAA